MRILIALSILMCSVFLNAQTVISGQLTDKENGELLMGATVLLQGTQMGSVADFDGNFQISSIPNGNYTLGVKYLGYKAITMPITANGIPIVLNFQMESDTKVLEGVMIVGKADRNTISAMTKLQQKSISMLTGITSQDIQRTPDRNTSDVLKRVSGTTVQDNKFVVIRGLADRYNVALMNGLTLPSSEPDRRAFSFDIFPASMMSNLVIYKTATPDLPGEFAGGVIELNTKDVPDEPFFQVSLGSIYNSISTFQPYSFYEGSNTDVLGFDRSARPLQDGVTKAALNGPDRFAVSKLVPNDWNVSQHSSMRPNYNVNFSGGTTTKLFGNDLGMVGALTYSNNFKYFNQQRAEYNVDTTRLFTYNDASYQNDVSVGGLLNLAYKIGENSKITLNNIVNQRGEDLFILRDGIEIEQERFNTSYAMWYKSTRLLSTQLRGEHGLGSNGIVLKWGGSVNSIDRTTPSFRRMTYYKNFDAQEGDPYFAVIPVGAPSPNFAGRFYSDQNELMYNANTDLSIPYKLFKKQNSLKAGSFFEMRDRSFDARVFGYTVTNFSKFDQNIPTQGINSIFDPSNIGDNGMVLKESTNPNDSYTAGSTLSGGFLMFDQWLTSKLKVIVGARAENFIQKLETQTFGGKPVNIDQATLDILPSANFIYSVSENSNIRLSGSQTVIRPNFRELAPFSFYDFQLSAAIVGNPELLRTKITNFDLKYEIFPGANENISITGFFKNFDKPIEQFYETLGAGTRNFNFKNATSAQNFGAEFEYRLRLSRISQYLSQFSLFGNLAYIRSTVDVSVDAASAANASDRALQGQSPYIINTGISFTSNDTKWGASILYNRIGRRIFLVGSNQYLDTYEAPRNVLDFQLTYKIFKDGEIKLNVQDVFNNAFVFYQDQNNSGDLDKPDTKIITFNPGTNVGIFFTYKF